jgi:hypothetical protein
MRGLIDLDKILPCAPDARDAQLERRGGAHRPYRALGVQSVLIDGAEEIVTTQNSAS